MAIKGSTHLLEAFDFDWDHTGDILWGLKNQNNPVWMRIGKRISDYIVYYVALVLRVDVDSLARKSISEITRREYKTYVETHRWTDFRNEKVILILNGEADLPTSPEKFQQLERQSQCKVLFVKVSELKDISGTIDTLKRQGNTIQVLWIRAHGFPQSILFSPYCQLKITPAPYEPYVYTPNELCEKHFKKLEANTPIILESCNTGQDMPEGQENIAQCIAKLAQRKVIAPMMQTLPIDITYSNGDFHVMMKSIKPASYFAKGSLFARLEAVWHAYWNHQIEISCVFLPSKRSKDAHPEV
jgi:hypothetical protein